MDFSGTPTISSGSAVDAAGVAAFNGVGAVYNAATTVGDQQIITGIFSDTGAKALVGRCNSARTSYILAVNLFGTSWAIFCFVAGSYTTIGSAYDTFTPGAAYSLVCGTGASANRNFQILKNGTPITFTTGSTTLIESGTTSQMGASYRYCGFGVDSPAKLSQWTFADNAPPAAVGSGFRAYRTTTTPVTLSAGDNLLANNFFDTVATVTTDLTSAPATNNKVTVSVAGWYVVTVSLALNIGSGGSAGPALYKNGSVIRHGTINTSLTGTGYYSATGTFVVYCAAGDYLQPGVYCDAGSVSGTKGEATGTWTYWELAFSNRGTLS